MDDTSLTTPDATLEAQRSCTRCDDQQLLVGSGQGMGTYRCAGCGMVVGFDLEASPAEFLIDRGLPARYTRHVFGDTLTSDERRLGR